MLKNSKAVKVQNVRKTDLISEPLQYRQEDADRIFREYLSAGYIVYDVVSNGGFNALSGKTPGKYICVWINGTPSGTYTSYNAAYTTHTDVVIFGVRIDTNYNLVSINNQFTLSPNVPEGVIDANLRLSFVFCNVIITSNVNNFSGAILHSKITITATIWIFLYNSPNINHSHLYTTSGYGYDCRTALLTIKNCILDSGIVAYPFGSNQKLILENCATLNNSIGIGISINTTIMDIELKNYFIADGLTVTLFATVLTNNNTIITNNTGTLLNISGTLKKYTALTNYWKSGVQSLTTSYLTSTNNYKYLNAKIFAQRVSQRGFLGTIKRNFYNLVFDSYFEIDDSLKYNDDTDLMLVWREDLETEFSTNLIAKIKNLLLYKSNGTTVVTNYRNNESFLIYATRDGQSDYAVFAWHKGEIKPTIYSEVWPDNLYTVVRIFQIWEHPEEVTMLNLYNIDDSPIEATYLMQDTTSKVFRI